MRAHAHIFIKLHIRKVTCTLISITVDRRQLLFVAQTRIYLPCEDKRGEGSHGVGQTIAEIWRLVLKTVWIEGSRLTRRRNKRTWPCSVWGKGCRGRGEKTRDNGSEASISTRQRHSAANKEVSIGPVLGMRRGIFLWQTNEWWRWKKEKKWWWALTMKKRSVQSSRGSSVKETQNTTQASERFGTEFYT